MAPATTDTAVLMGNRPSIASAGYVVMTARGITKVNTVRMKPLKTDTGQRAASKIELKRYVMLSTFTTKKAALMIR